MARHDERPGMDDHHKAQCSKPSERIAVMDWLLAVGNVAMRKLRGRPRSPMVRLH